MKENKLKVVILTHGGADRLLELLSELENVEIAAVLVEMPTEPKRTLKRKIQRSVRYDGYLATLKKFSAKFAGKETGGINELKVIQEKQNTLENFAREANIPFYKFDNFHSAEAVNTLKNLNANLGILYGTNIIRESVFGIPRLGSINFIRV